VIKAWNVVCAPGTEFWTLFYESPRGVVEVGVGREMQLNGQQSSRGHKIGVKINTLNEKKKWFSAINRFQIVEQNSRKFNKLLWLLYNLQFPLRVAIVVTCPGGQNLNYATGGSSTGTTTAIARQTRGLRGPWSQRVVQTRVWQISCGENRVT
jgi:hypothetical protein